MIYHHIISEDMEVNDKTDIHKAAEFFYPRISGAGGIIVLTNRPECVVDQYPSSLRLFIVCDPLAYFRCWKTVLSAPENITFLTTLSLNANYVKDKLFVCVDYLQHKRLGSRFIAKSIVTHFARLAPLSLVSASPSDGWDQTSLRSLFPKNHTLLEGIIRGSNNAKTKDTLLAIGGELTDLRSRSFPHLRILAILHVFNEQDVISSTINHLLTQGVDVYVIDNWSTDETFEIVKSIAAKSGRVAYERFPRRPNNAFELEKMLLRVTDVARQKREYSWIILNDADEIRWSPWKDVTIQEAISFIDSLGYNAVDYTVFNFSPTREGFNEDCDLITFFDYGEFSGISGHFVQVKTWKNVPDAEIANSGGHRVSFPDQRIFPLKFLLAHYPIRSTEHGLTKIFKERRGRYSKKERSKGWHVHYDKVSKETSFLKNKDELINAKRGFLGRYVLERVSGVGIERENE